MNAASGELMIIGALGCIMLGYMIGFYSAKQATTPTAELVQPDDDEDLTPEERLLKYPDSWKYN